MTMTTMIIYKAKNIENEKVYIGMSKYPDLETRKKQHLYKSKDQSNEFYKDLFNNPELFVWEIIESLQYEEAIQFERKWIHFYKDENRSYNNSWGQGTYKIVYSDESREKIAATKRGALCYKSKLTDSDLVEIRNLISLNQKTQKQIADLFDVTQATISFIKNGKTWQNLSA